MCEGLVEDLGRQPQTASGFDGQRSARSLQRRLVSVSISALTPNDKRISVTPTPQIRTL